MMLKCQSLIDLDSSFKNIDSNYVQFLTINDFNDACAQWQVPSVRLLVYAFIPRLHADGNGTI